MSGNQSYGIRNVDFLKLWDVMMETVFESDSLTISSKSTWIKTFDIADLIHLSFTSNKPLIISIGSEQWLWDPFDFQNGVISDSHHVNRTLDRIINVDKSWTDITISITNDTDSEANITNFVIENA